MVAADGGIFAFGDAKFFGSMGGKPLNAPIVGMAATRRGGYWMVASDGGIFAFGDAKFYGSLGQAVGLTARRDGALGERDRVLDRRRQSGQVFAFGDAEAFGQIGKALNKPVVAMAPMH